MTCEHISISPTVIKEDVPELVTPMRILRNDLNLVLFHVIAGTESRLWM